MYLWCGRRRLARNEISDEFFAHRAKVDDRLDFPITSNEDGTSPFVIVPLIDRRLGIPVTVDLPREADLARGDAGWELQEIEKIVTRRIRLHGGIGSQVVHEVTASRGNHGRLELRVIRCLQPPNGCILRITGRATAGGAKYHERRDAGRGSHGIIAYDVPMRGVERRGRCPIRGT